MTAIDTLKPWDYLIVTASNDAQARSYELQLRLRAGKVYPGREVERALRNFFKHENLAALRELALREVAEDVEARRQPSVFDPTAENSCISTSPTTPPPPGPRTSWSKASRKRPRPSTCSAIGMPFTGTCSYGG